MFLLVCICSVVLEKFLLIGKRQVQVKGVIEQVKEIYGRGFTANKKYGADGEPGRNSCISSSDLL